MPCHCSRRLTPLIFYAEFGDPPSLCRRHLCRLRLFRQRCGMDGLPHASRPNRDGEFARRVRHRFARKCHHTDRGSIRRHGREQANRGRCGAGQTARVGHGFLRGGGVNAAALCKKTEAHRHKNCRSTKHAWRTIRHGFWEFFRSKFC